MPIFRRMDALIILWLLASPSVGYAFDHEHRAFTQLLARHVVWNATGTGSTVDYAGFQQDQAPLNAYSAQLSAVTSSEFSHWAVAERRAFLINAYNAFTIELILTRYPNINSIRDLGNIVFSSPWKKRFFVLLESPRHLDEIEQQLLRRAADFDEPRIHFAVNCASIGCPALRPEAYDASRLDEQLDDQVSRFLRDRTRNRFSGGARATAFVSPIFRWYAEDFEAGYHDIASVQRFLARYAAALGDTSVDRARIEQGEFALAYTDYDWALNVTRPADRLSGVQTHFR